jgi:hypothetical protein
MIVVGRQRVGKTSFLNALAQHLGGRGADFAIWDADQMNATHNMSAFHALTAQTSLASSSSECLVASSSSLTRLRLTSSAYFSLLGSPPAEKMLEARE